MRMERAYISAANIYNYENLFKESRRKEKHMNYRHTVKRCLSAVLAGAMACSGVQVAQLQTVFAQENSLTTVSP